MLIGLAKRALFETDKRLLWKLAWNMGWKGFRSIQKHKKRLRNGRFFPPYLYISIVNSCNLRCQGCWVDVAHKQHTIDVPALNRMIDTAKKQGNAFFGILGGEPFMHKGLFDVLEAHPNVYFQVFTNGHFITDEVAKRLRKCGNVTPLISIEGSELISDQRRGKSSVFEQSMTGVKNCVKNKVMTGVCTSLCQSNFDDLLNEAWIDRLVDLGVLYTWFHIYRPVGPQPTPELALTQAQQRQAREFVVNMRCKKPIIIIDAYYDANGEALCPAATGFTHHINPWGGIEPCPIIQFAKESIHDARPLDEVFNESSYLSDFRELAAKHTRGCIALERPDLIESLVARHGAEDNTARKTALAELKAANVYPSQYMPDQTPIPEKSWLYRVAKKIAFHEYGVYTKHFKIENWQDPMAAEKKQDALIQIHSKEPAASNK